MERDPRRGEHPLDERLSEAGMLAWFAPTFALLAGHLARVAPFALAFGAFIWLLPHITLAGPFQSGGWRGFLDAVLQTVVSTAIMVTGFRTLAAAEGAPYGVGAVRPLVEAAGTLVGLMVFWAVAGWVVGKLIGSLFQTPAVLRLMFSLFNSLGLWGIYAVIIALSPLAIMLASVSALTYVRAIRAEEPFSEVLSDSFAAVFGQPGRFVPASLVIATVLVLAVHLGGQRLGQTIVRLFFEFGMLIFAVLGAVATLIAIPWWFVQERALRPHLGVEADPDGADAPSDIAGAVAAAAAAAAPVDQAARFSALVASDGAVPAARRLVAELRGRRLDSAGFEAGLAGLADPAPVLPELAVLANDWQEASRPGELAWLVGTGLKLDRAFLMDRPDQVLAIGKRLAQQQHVQLAGRLLLNFLNRHRRHPDHAEVGVQMARLMAFSRDDSAGARRLLEQLQPLHPDNPAIAALLRQLP
ncbi:MAG: hypothetical protein KF823_09790 [Xanthomonadales bacterium]|nr:hypothetical protein [Xanthomonadales bacterium]